MAPGVDASAVGDIQVDTTVKSCLESPPPPVGSSDGKEHEPTKDESRCSMCLKVTCDIHPSTDHSFKNLPKEIAMKMKNIGPGGRVAFFEGSSLNGDFGGYFKNAITGDEFHLSGKIRPSKFNKDEDEEKKASMTDIVIVAMRRSAAMLGVLANLGLAGSDILTRFLNLATLLMAIAEEPKIAAFIAKYAK